MHHIDAGCQRESKEGIGSPGTEVPDGCELACGCWGTEPRSPGRAACGLTTEQPPQVLVSFDST